MVDTPPTLSPIIVTIDRVERTLALTRASLLLIQEQIDRSRQQLMKSRDLLTRLTRLHPSDGRTPPLSG